MNVWYLEGEMTKMASEQKQPILGVQYFPQVGHKRAMEFYYLFRR